MKKIAVVYSSKSGHTKQYADWLKEEVGDIDVIPVASFSPSQTMAYKLVIFACGVYGDKLSIMDYVKKNITAMAPQKTMIMAVTWYTNDSEEAKQKLIEENYPEQFKSGNVPIFVLNSGVDKKSLSAMDKMKLTAAQVMIDKKDGRSTDDINALAIIKGYSDQTSKDNLASIIQAIDLFFNPPKATKPAASAAAPKPAAPSPAPAAKPAATAPAPKPAPVPKPMDVSEMKSDADALSSLENAFKALGAPKAAPQPKPEPKPEPAPVPPPQPKPQPKPTVDPVKASVASSVKDAIAALSSGEMTTNYNPAPTFEIDDSDSDTYSEAVADSLMLLNQAAADSKPKPAPTPAPVAPKAEQPAPAQTAPAAPKAAQPAPAQSAPVAPKAAAPAQTAPAAPKAAQPAPAQSAPVAPKAAQSAPAQAAPAAPKAAEPAVEKPQATPPRKNSYMELFAQRRRNPTTASSETTAPAAPTAPAVNDAPAQTAAPKPAPRPTAKPATQAQPTAQPAARPAAQAAPKPAVRPVPPPAAPGKSSNTVIDFDFIMDDGPVPEVAPPEPKSVQSAQPAPTASIDMDVYDFISEDDSKPAASSRAMNAVQDLAKAKAEAEKEKLKAAAVAENMAESNKNNNDIIEKMKRDLEALAEESEQEIEVASTPPAEAVEVEDEGLDGFMFSNDVDYDLEAEFAEPAIISEEKAVQEKQSKTDLDIRKLQEEINASIEQNKATKEKMAQRYGKKEKEEYHNPFAVQFEEDDSKNKKKKKTVEVKRLADPIDPDIFFNKAGKDYDSTPGAMPEIKFRNR
ncbi:MAG: hypothetical protein HDT24_05185 [Ruminococcus sp.]|nr:hypothetical protein [Ruminococcus sp.]